MSPALTMFEVTPDHPVPISPQGGTATVTVLSGDTLYYADTPQVSAAHNQGSVTAGNVQSFTNPAWVRSASLSTVLAQITAATVPTASLPGSVALANSPQGDPLNRTQVLGSSTVAAPSLRQFVFVDDLPFGAAGDVKRITDGAMTSGANQLSSPSYTFTAVDVGKVVEVLGAITTATAPNLYGYVGSVAAGVASIVSTHGGGTPVNASVTVTGATVTFGTDDSTAVQTVANAVSGAGGGIVAFTPFKGYWWSKHVPASNVTYHGNGATFYVMPLPSDGVNINPAIWLAPNFSGQSAHSTTVSGAGQTITSTPSTLAVVSTAGFASSGTLYVAGVTGTVTYTGISDNSFTGCTVPTGSFTATNGGRVANVGVSNVTFRQMVWVGHGKEVHQQYPIAMQGCTNTRLYDCDFSLFAPNGTYLIDTTGVRVVNCTYTNVCAVSPPGTSTTGNPLNLSPQLFSDAYPMTDMHVLGCTITGQISEGVDITPGSTGNPPQSVSFKAEILGNTITGATTTAAAIDMELGGTGAAAYPAQDVVIANNVCTNGTIAAVINPSVLPVDQTLLSRIVIAGNTVNGSSTTAACIDCRASYAEITGNIVKGAVGLSVSSDLVNVAVTGDFTNASTQVLNVAGGGAVINGTPVTGTGVPAGTFLQAGAGTTTWTLSQAFTGTTGTGLAATAHPQAQNIKIAENNIHIVAGGTSTIYGIQTNYIRNSSIADNGVTFDSGVAAGRGISIQNSGWVRVRDNDVDSASSDGVYVVNCNDVRIKDNDIYNPSASVAGYNGIRFNVATGTHNLVARNDIVDDRATHLMYNAVQTGGTSQNVRVRDNFWAGFTNAPMDSLTGVVEVRGNLPYSTTWPAAPSSPAAPASGTALASVGYRREVYWYGGTVTVVNKTPSGGAARQINNGSPGMTILDPGDAVTWTYTVAPTLQIIPVV